MLLLEFTIGHVEIQGQHGPMPFNFSTWETNQRGVQKTKIIDKPLAKQHNSN
jgi:hypothetical protein